MKINFSFFFALLLPLIAMAAGATPSVIEIAIAPDAKARQDLAPFIEQLLVGAAPGDTINLFSVQDQTRISSITLSSDIPDATPQVKLRWLVKFHANQLRQIGAFLKTPARPDSRGGNADIVRYLNGLSLLKAEFAGRPIKAIYVGSPIVSAPAYSMVNSYPSDSFLLATDSNLYSTAGREKSLQGIEAHIVHSPTMGEFSSVDAALHKSKIERFFGIFLANQGATLSSFSSSTEHLAKIKTTKYRQTAYGKADPGDGKLRSTEIKPARLVLEEAALQKSLWTNAISLNPPPPSGVLTGPIELAIKWTAPNRSVDMDIYTQVGGDREISYKMQNSPQYGAKHLQDIQSQQPGQGVFETVVYSGQVPIRDIAVFINHFSGKTTEPVELEFRVRYGNNIYAKRYRMPAGPGSGGKSNRSASPSWLKISLFDVMGLRG